MNNAQSTSLEEYNRAAKKMMDKVTSPQPEEVKDRVKAVQKAASKITNKTDKAAAKAVKETKDVAEKAEGKVRDTASKAENKAKDAVN